VGAVVLVDAALLLATVNEYGYHRDELYFRILAAHPAWGYVDQPPLTPMLARLGIDVLGDNLWALRVPAMLCALAAVVLTALLARELGGRSGAQTLAAAGISATFVLVAGHVLLTASADLVVWLLVLLFAARALLRAEPRWWLGVGVVVGVGLWNKQLVVLLLLGVVVGLLVAGPRRELRSGWLWAGAGLALVIGLPNLLYQVANGWPELTMARAIAEHKGHDDRVFFLPLQVVLLGLTVVPIWVAGLVQHFRDPAMRAVRALAWAYPVVCVVTLVTGGQPYYTFGLLAYLYAAGCVVVARWAAGHRSRWVLAGTAVAVSWALAVVVALPLIPVRSLPPAIARINQTARDSVGWPAYVQEVAAAYRTLPPADREHAVLLAGNYGEAGALDRFGPDEGLPRVYSGQNQLYELGPPPADAAVVVTVGFDDPSPYFRACTTTGVLDDHVGVDNEEQGRTIMVCRDPLRPWAQLWSSFRHYD
jgi:4-amino-4-deoxy-L-arabinose transferase-like glycosyltransferase